MVWAGFGGCSCRFTWFGSVGGVILSGDFGGEDRVRGKIDGEGGV